MKKYLTIVLLMLSFCVFSQNYIKLKNGKSIKNITVHKFNDFSVEYVKNGSVHDILKDNINFILENNETITFDENGKVNFSSWKKVEEKITEKEIVEMKTKIATTKVDTAKSNSNEAENLKNNINEKNIDSIAIYNRMIIEASNTGQYGKATELFKKKQSYIEIQAMEKKKINSIHLLETQIQLAIEKEDYEKAAFLKREKDILLNRNMEQNKSPQVSYNVSSKTQIVEKINQLKLINKTNELDNVFIKKGTYSKIVLNDGKIIVGKLNILNAKTIKINSIEIPFEKIESIKSINTRNNIISKLVSGIGIGFSVVSIIDFQTHDFYPLATTISTPILISTIPVFLSTAFRKNYKMSKWKLETN